MERGCARRVSRSAWAVQKCPYFPTCCGWSATQPRSGSFVVAADVRRLKPVSSFPLSAFRFSDGASLRRLLHNRGAQSFFQPGEGGFKSVVFLPVREIGVEYLRTALAAPKRNAGGSAKASPVSGSIASCVQKFVPLVKLSILKFLGTLLNPLTPQLSCILILLILWPPGIGPSILN